MVREDYRIGVPAGGHWLEIFNSDAARYGGSNTGNGAGVLTEEVERHGHSVSLSLIVPPLGVVILRPQV
ncbi:1,4-alpha-glucan branching enzyme GlgB [compost metagenome]